MFRYVWKYPWGFYLYLLRLSNCTFNGAFSIWNGVLQNTSIFLVFRNCTTVAKSGDTFAGLWWQFGVVSVSCRRKQKNSHCKPCVMIHVNVRQKEDFQGTQQSFMIPKVFLTLVAPVLEADHCFLRRGVLERPSCAIRSFSFKGQNFPWTDYVRATTGKKKKKKKTMRTR